MIALSGVRSSCDMLARNSDLCWLAISSSRLLSSISRNRRAFSSESTDCVANVLSSSMTSGLYSPGALRLTERLPMMRSSNRSGTESRARNPARTSTSRCRVS